jgi:hypothetical protein
MATRVALAVRTSQQPWKQARARIYGASCWVGLGRHPQSLTSDSSEKTSRDENNEKWQVFFFVFLEGSCTLLTREMNLTCVE